ncbi:MAG TPA: tetratricopeptide repeat protein [Armatimonadota bacterium]|nr:tetratricopeptide repeat protein [Armatimonadota bacterium]
MVPFFLFTISINRLLDQGQQLLDDGQPREALAALEKGLGTAPRNSFLLLYAGLARAECGESDSGLRQIQQAMDLSPDNWLFPFFYARALYDAGDYAAAADQCRRVEAVQQDHPGAIVLRRLCEGRKDPLVGLTGLALHGLSDDIHLQARALQFAEEILRPAHRPTLPVWPGDRAPWDPHSGIRTAPEVHQIPGGAREWLRRSRMMQESGQGDRALVFAEAAMQENPDDETRALLATLYDETGRCAETEAALREFLPEDPERNTLIGAAHFEMGHFYTAAEALQKAERDSARAAHTLGRALLEIGRTAEARIAFLRAARLDPAIPPARIALAYLEARGARTKDEGRRTEDELSQHNDGR